MNEKIKELTLEIDLLQSFMRLPSETCEAEQFEAVLYPNI
jgi:hypothetical protein